MKPVEVERRQRVDPEEFAHRNLAAQGLPLVVTDAMHDWAAPSKWSFEFLRSEFGSDFATAMPGLGCDAARLTTLAAYLDFLARPEQGLAGFWVDNWNGNPLAKPPAMAADPLYLLGWQAFQKHPELYRDISPAPYFISDWLLGLPFEVLQQLERACGREYWSIYIGPPDAVSKLHCDFWSTHAYLAQLRGRKRVMLFSPQDAPFLYNGEVDPERPDFERFPEFAKARAHVCTIGPGELLFMPADWWHCVRALDDSITVSHNFFNQSNVAGHVSGLSNSHPELAAALAAMSPA